MFINFFYFKVGVTSGDCCIVIFARIKINNLPVHLGYNRTSNGSRVNLQLFKSYKDVNGHEESVSWLLKERADFVVFHTLISPKYNWVKMRCSHSPLLPTSPDQ